jgi:hypothetical protein
MLANLSVILSYLFVVAAVLVRVGAGTGAFATKGFGLVGAALLFFGSRMPRKHFWIPVVLLIGSDFYLNLKVYGIALSWEQGIIWAWYLGACFIGVLLRDRVKPINVLGAGLGSAVSFFLVSNFAVWLSGRMYPMNWTGLMASYTAAIPFFQRGVESDLLFSTVFFSIPVLIAYTSRATANRSEAA